jgi:hypothetical protein
MSVSPDPGFKMTANRKKKLSARDLAVGTGLSYTAALRSLDSRQVPSPGKDRPAPPGLIEARHAGVCGYCGRKIFPGARIAAYREHWGHARCISDAHPVNSDPRLQDAASRDCPARPGTGRDGCTPEADAPT